MNAKGFKKFTAVNNSGLGCSKSELIVKKSSIIAIHHANRGHHCDLFLIGVSEPIRIKGSYDEIVKDLFGDTLK